MQFSQEPPDDFQPIPIIRERHTRETTLEPEYPRPRPRPRRMVWKVVILLLVGLAFYFFFPLRTNVLILGIDYMPHRGELSRTDTLILATIIPLKPYLGMLSIPRDLWVSIPGRGENRINTAYYYAETEQEGSGAVAAVDTVRTNFGVHIDHYLILNMQGVVAMINALGGVDISLQAPMGGLPAGDHHLNGDQALAFARERYSADDISRMAQGQLLIKAGLQKLLNPLNWLRLPGLLIAAGQAVETDIPGWLWPRLGLALLRAGPQGMDTRLIDREMVTPYQTADGAQVLIPDWTLINPVLLEMFGE